MSGSSGTGGMEAGARDGRGWELSDLRGLERPGWDWHFGSAPPGASAPLSFARDAESSRVD